MEIETAGNWYGVRTSGDGVIHIEEPHIVPFYRCNIWRVERRKRNLLVDSGSGVVSLSEHVSCVSGRPVTVSRIRSYVSAFPVRDTSGQGIRRTSASITTASETSPVWLTGSMPARISSTMVLRTRIGGHRLREVCEQLLFVFIHGFRPMHALANDRTPRGDARYLVRDSFRGTRLVAARRWFADEHCEDARDHPDGIRAVPREIPL